MAVDDLTPVQQALADADEALRDGRHMLERLIVDLFGVGVEAPKNSQISETIERMRKAGDQCRNALMGRA